MIFKQQNFLLLYIVAFLLISAILILRVYNLNFDQLWWDEIIAFYTADPTLSFSQTVSRNFELELSPPTFNLLLKFFFKIFGYHTYVGRYLSVIAGFLTCIIISLIVYDLTKRNFAYFLLSLLLSGINITLIGTSQEMRLYSFLILVVTALIYFFNKLVNEKDLKIKKYYLIFFLTFAIFSILIQPFTISLLCVSVIYILSFNRQNIKEFGLFLSSTLFSFIPIFVYYYFIYLNQIDTSLYPDSLGQIINFKFLTNLYFSKFFGSRLMGLIYLLILILLIFLNRKIIFKLNNFPFYLLLIIVITYLIPIVYGFIFKPILIVRYVLFVLVPILIFIPSQIYFIQNHLIKKFFLVIIMISTLLNLLTEQSFKQFFFQRPIFKPDFYSAFKIISQSDENNFTFSTKDRNSKHFLNIEKALNNFSNIYAAENDFEIKYISSKDLENIKSKNIWLICTYEINFQCEDELMNNKTKLVKEISLNRLNLKLLNIN